MKKNKVRSDIGDENADIQISQFRKRYNLET